MAGTIAITGGSGFVGSHLVLHLLSRGWTVRALSRSGGADLPGQGEIACQGSLDDPSSMARLIEGADAVIHCAGLIKAHNRQAFFHINADATAQLARLCAASSTCRHFIYLSSLAARMPGLSNYAASKYAGEESLSAQETLSWTIVRPPVIYGPGDRETYKLFRYMKRGIVLAPGSIQSRVSFLYVDDLCAALSALLALPTGLQSVLDIHDDSPMGYGWEEIAQVASQSLGHRVRAVPVPRSVAWPIAVVNASCGQLFGYTPMLTPGKLREAYHPDWVSTLNPIIELTDWKPNVTILEGFSRSIKWYQQQGWL